MIKGFVSQETNCWMVRITVRVRYASGMDVATLRNNNQANRGAAYSFQRN